MRTEKDFKEFIKLLNRHKVRYLIVGGFAFSYYSEPRYTKDIDIFIEPSPNNVSGIMKVLDDFGFGSLGLREEDFLEKGQIIQLGNEPVRIDLLNSIRGIDFTSAWNNRTTGNYGDETAYFISKSDLIKNKEATNRIQDMADIEKLKE